MKLTYGRWIPESAVPSLGAAVAAVVALGLAGCRHGEPEDPFADFVYPELEAPPPPPVVTLEMPEDGTLYHGVYPGGRTGWEDDITDADIGAYVEAVGHEVAWVYFSHNWFHGEAFPTSTVEMIQQRGSTPWIRLMMRSELDEVDGPDPTYPMERIRRGDFDDALRAWGAAAAAVEGPILAEWGTEMNGEWFAWNASHHGGAAGAALFAETYQHIVAVVAEGGADNITWVFHVNDGDFPSTYWNRFEAYDPGPEVCPWVAVSVYGAQEPTERDWWAFAEGMDAAYPRLVPLADGRPIVLAEFGVTAGARGDPVVWAGEALEGLLGHQWPEVQGLSWWNETWENSDDPSEDTEMRVTEIPGMADRFRAELDGKVTERPIVGAP